MSFSSNVPFYKSRGFLIAAINIVIILAIAGFFYFSSSGNKEKTAKPTTTTVNTRPSKKDAIAPLTGLVDPTGESYTRPALAIKIGNNPEARPQAGITQADIVYEEIVEGGITRFMGIYNSTVPERVGPVRSVRGMDPDITLNWGGIFAYSGGAAHNEVKIKNTKGILALNETAAGSGMKRDPSRSAPNNLYAIPSELFKRTATPVPPQPQFSYSKEVSLLADPASSFVVGFRSGFDVKWEYDRSQNKYVRIYKGAKVLDQNGAHVTASNVVVQFINYPSDSEGITTGTGDVWLFRDGKVVKGTWERQTTDKPAKFTDSEGKQITLLAGQTWVELASTTTKVTVTP